MFAGPVRVYSLFGKVRKVNCPVVDGLVAAAVFVDASPGVERRWSDVLKHSIGRAPHHDFSPAFLRTRFDPINIFPVDSHLLEPDTA